MWTCIPTENNRKMFEKNKKSTTNMTMTNKKSEYNLVVFTETLHALSTAHQHSARARRGATTHRARVMGTDKNILLQSEYAVVGYEDVRMCTCHTGLEPGFCYGYFKVCSVRACAGMRSQSHPHTDPMSWIPVCPLICRQASCADTGLRYNAM